eukprot:14551467-Alexandrium_andersonii.AAC.1
MPSSRRPAGRAPPRRIGQGGHWVTQAHEAVAAVLPSAPCAGAAPAPAAPLPAPAAPQWPPEAPRGRL